ncbi:hypothetical protein N0V88_001357 [Collariella sp. IMI 366227]|nr:hypothetical protein N0V88_001357 [Collariella sp. IMI 366227]
MPRLSTRELTPDESLYEIRDIIGEKYEKGRLLYRVDWADNPTTGERYDPTWEPAANVTEATVADWKKHKRQQQERQRTSSSTPIPSIEPDGQPVLLPNPRAKRQRDFELSEQNVRASKRPRQSADSGYTSTEAEPQSSWELLSSKPNNKGRLVCELSIPPGFDPSQYLVISSAQSAPASQAVLSNAASSQVEGNRRVTPISQRTIPDSQDSFDSLHTLTSSKAQILRAKPAVLRLRFLLDRSRLLKVPDDPLHTGHGMEFEQQPTTVAPADLTTSIEHLHGGDEDLSTDHQFLGAPEQSAVSADIQPDHFPLHMEEEDEDEEEALSRHFTVTLPMAANTRSIYLDTIAENKPTMIEFGQFFSEELVPDGPDASLVAKMDIIFEKLLNLCDLPAYDDSLPALSKEEIRKHATNSNSKYSFVYEFLHGLDDINTRIMILSQPGRVFECLEAVISASGFPYTVFGQDGSGQTMDSDGSSVVLAVAGQDLSRIRGGIDVVIAFDHVARSIDLPANLGYESMPPMILSLVTTYSLEHIDQQLQSEPGLDVLERKNALNLATGAAREHVRNPEYLRDSKGRYLEPHSIAKMFSDFLRDPERGLEWEPHPLPSEIVEVWLSQGQESHDAHQTQILRKRHLDNAIDEGTPKRLRLLESRLPSRTATPAQMSDLLRQTLAKQPVSRAGTPVVEVPVDKLERMASKIAELEARLAKQSDYEAKLRDQVSSLESEVRSHQKTASTLQPRFKEAIGDRGRFEKECQAAVVKMNAASERLETQKADVEALKEKNRALESQLKEANDALANSTVPEAAKVAQAENACAEALAKVEKLEKKLKNLQADAEYARDAYQRASNAHTVLNQENQELSKKVAGLERRASENLLKIHQVHAHNEMSEVARQIDELQALLENRERELDRAKEELKFLKNGRRETRQGSVPRTEVPVRRR